MLEEIIKRVGFAVLFNSYGCSTIRNFYPVVDKMNVKIIYFCNGEIELINRKMYCDGKHVYPLVIRNF